MTCCGSKRQQLRPTARLGAGAAGAGTPASAFRPVGRQIPVAYFQYLGTKGVTVLGPRTGKLYRFTSRGAVVAVDVRDRPSVAAVPEVVEVRGP